METFHVDVSGTVGVRRIGREEVVMPVFVGDKWVVFHGTADQLRGFAESILMAVPPAPLVQQQQTEVQS